MIALLVRIRLLLLLRNWLLLLRRRLLVALGHHVAPAANRLRPVITRPAVVLAV